MVCGPNGRAGQNAQNLVALENASDQEIALVLLLKTMENIALVLDLKKNFA